jgi:uncharacterized protein YjbJ (UPF0337 family)
MSHAFDKFKGRVKEVVGDVTGNRKLKNQGKRDQVSARVKAKSAEAVGKAKAVLHRS